MKNILLLCLFHFLGLAQIQIGSDLDGKGVFDIAGTSVSISSDGSTVAIGAPNSIWNSIDPGYVRIYKKASDTWTQIGVDIIGDSETDWFGYSVSLSADGKVLAIGIPFTDRVRIYRNINDTWTQIGLDIIGNPVVSGYAMSVSLSADGTTVAFGNQNAERVCVYKNVLGTWTQTGQLINGYGVSLSADGTTIAILKGVRTDHVCIYKNTSGAWIQIGTGIDGKVSDSFSGTNVSLSDDGSTVAIGFPYNYISTNHRGQARIYRNSGGTWVQLGLDINGSSLVEYFGHSISLSADGNIMAVGAAGEDMSTPRPGYVRIYKYTGGAWTQLGLDIVGEGGSDQSGYSVSLSADASTVAIGAPFNDGNGIYSGHVRVYDLSALLKSDSFVLASFSVYPNPTSEIINISLQNNLILEKVNIYNVLGQLIKTEKQSKISVKSLSKGSYFVEVITSQGKATKTILVE